MLGSSSYDCVCPVYHYLHRISGQGTDLSSTSGGPADNGRYTPLPSYCTQTRVTSCSPLRNFRYIPRTFCFLRIPLGAHGVRPLRAVCEGACRVPLKPPFIK